MELVSVAKSNDPLADITYSAYISIELPKQSQNLFLSSSLSSQSSWKRCYAVIRNRSLLYYSSRQAFTTNPGRPMNLRPLELSDFNLASGSSGNNGGDMSFIISLVPANDDMEKKTWHLRCDTASEYNEWVETFRRNISSQEQ